MEKLMVRYAASQTLLPQVRTVARSLYSVGYKDGGSVDPDNACPYLQRAFAFAVPLADVQG